MEDTTIMRPGDIVFKDPWGTGFVMESEEKDFVKVNFPQMGQTLVLSPRDSTIDYISKRKPFCIGNAVFSLKYGYGWTTNRSLERGTIDIAFPSQNERARFKYDLAGYMLNDDGSLKYKDDINQRNMARVYSVSFGSPFLPADDTTGDFQEINRRLAKIEEKLNEVSQKADKAYGLALM